MLNRYIISVIVVVSVTAVIVAFSMAARKYYKKSRSKAYDEPISDSPEECFVKEWTQAFNLSAKTFNGLYQGLQRIVEGKAKKPEKVLREWCARTRYQWEQQQPSELCEELIVPLLDSGDQTELGKWAQLLLQAAEAAGITKGKTGKLILDEQNVNDYTEWEGEPLYVEDEVEIVQPAWYQNDILLEQGRCRKEEGEE